MSAALSYRRLRAPSADGGRLIEPAAAELDAVLSANRQRLSAPIELAGRPLSAIRQLARREVLAAAQAYSASYGAALSDEPVADAEIFLAGHQPQLFHPGVWFKNFALSALAARRGAIAINLVIDSDTIKSTSVAVPSGSVAAPELVRVRLDQPSPEIPFEERAIADRALLTEFGSRAAAALAPLVADPLLKEFWPLVVERASACDNLGWCLAQARHQLEAAWGSRTLEVPQSHVCRTESFAWFVAAMLGRAGELREAYNGGIREYRRVNHIRSVSHPVPELEADGPWHELPLWVWRTVDPRRRRLFARSAGGQIELSDRADWTAAVPAPGTDASRTVDALTALARGGVKLRSRALATTMFARLVLGDLFVHGIGGAKYDELTDAIIGRFFGVSPPGYLTISATLRLPIPHRPATPDELREARHRLRELQYHPERFLAEGHNGQAAAWIAAKRRWIAMVPDRATARQRCGEIRAANEALQPLLAPLRQSWTERQRLADERLRHEALLGSREYPFCFYPAAALRQLMHDPLAE